MDRARAIGVFDSGVGGLTVLRALRERLPHEATVYLGDTARVPYGTRSADAVIRYARNNARTLLEKADLKLLVVACNTASAVALPMLAAELPIPVLGVIEPGARAALSVAGAGHIAVLGTAGTIRSGAYEAALVAEGHTKTVSAQACPLLVPLVEEGWLDGTVPELVVARYMAGLPPDTDTVILGCTHYPLLRDVIEAGLPAGTHVVDGGAATAEEVAALLEGADALAAESSRPAPHTYLVTDAPEQMLHLASRFLGTEVPAEDVHLVDVTIDESLTAAGAPRSEPS